MNYLAVAAPMVHHTEIAPTSSTGVTPASASSILGGAAILGVLAVMLVAGCSAAGLRSKGTERSRPRTSNTIYPIR